MAAKWLEEEGFSWLWDSAKCLASGWFAPTLRIGTHTSVDKNGPTRQRPRACSTCVSTGRPLVFALPTLHTVEWGTTTVTWPYGRSSRLFWLLEELKGRADAFPMSETGRKRTDGAELNSFTKLPVYSWPISSAQVMERFPDQLLPLLETL